MCNRYECSCSEDDVEMDTVLENCLMTSISEISTDFYKPNSVTKISREQSFNSDSYELSSTPNVPTVSLNSSNNQHQADKSYSPSDSNQNTCSLNLNSKGINNGHLNVQGICGDKMSKFSEISAILATPENNKLHIFGMSETKLKIH